jgi:hypothetical protein
LPNAVSRTDRLRQRNDRIVTFTLIELLTQLVFVAMALGILLADAARKEFDPKRDIVAELRAQLAAEVKHRTALEGDLAAANDQVASLKRFVERLLGNRPAGELPAKPKDIADIVAEAANREAVITAQQRVIADQTRRLSHGGSDLPNCTVTPGYLLTVTLHGDGRYSTTAAWDTNAATVAARVPAVSAVVRRGELTQSEFESYAKEIKAWSSQQNPPCRFRVGLRSDHHNYDLFLRQQATVGNYFYAARVQQIR